MCIFSLVARGVRRRVCVYRFCFVLYFRCSRWVCGAMCVYFSLLARGMSGCLFVFAYSFCYSFIASAVYARHCVCLFHWSLGVCRAVRSFSLILSVIHSLFALCMRGTVCVYFIARPGYVGLFVYFRFRFILFIHCSHCICEAVLVYILFLARGMSASACVYIFIHEFVLLAPQSLICRQCMCHIICLKFCVFLYFLILSIHIISMI